MIAKLNREKLIENFRSLVQSERKITGEIIEYIKEIDSRRVYLDLGFTSLFAYLTQGIGYTAASAQRRIDSARLLRDLPEIKNEIQTGALNLMQLSVVAQSVRAKEKQVAVHVSTADKKEILRQVQNQNLFETQTAVAEYFDWKFWNLKRYVRNRIGRFELK